MNPTLFRLLSVANHLFTVTWCFSLLLLLMFYPSKLAGTKTVVGVYFLALFIWANQTIQFIEMPIHAYYGLNHIVPYSFGIIVGCMQWRRTAQRPVERAALRWFVLSIWISIGVSGSFFIVPSLTPNIAGIPLWVPALSILLMFICFALGIFRYGLFNLERWWFAGWTWLVAGLLVSAIDIILVFAIDVRVELVLPSSILLLGWIYFPIRHWLWQNIVKPETYQLDHHLPVLIQSLFNSRSMQSFIDRWAELLKQVFQPLDIIVEQGTHREVAVLQHGLELQVPNLNSKNFCRLIGNRQGSRLFVSQDINLANSLLSLSKALFIITNRTGEIQKEGAEKERDRIMRDLHDDVLPKLISIKHQAPTPGIAKMAEAAFQSTRETIYLLRHPSIKPMEEVLSDWRAETAERLNTAGLKLQWDAPFHDRLHANHLTPRQYVNCGRILREAISNIIQHSCADTAYVMLKIDIQRLHITIIDNGRGVQTENLKGLGTNNMRKRASALNGRIAWIPNPNSESGLKVTFSFPIKEIEARQFTHITITEEVTKEIA
jgi:signal transduction histidine kinase